MAKKKQKNPFMYDLTNLIDMLVLEEYIESWLNKDTVAQSLLIDYIQGEIMEEYQDVQSKLTRLQR